MNVYMPNVQVAAAQAPQASGGKQSQGVTQGNAFQQMVAEALQGSGQQSDSAAEAEGSAVSSQDMQDASLLMALLSGKLTQESELPLSDEEHAELPTGDLTADLGANGLVTGLAETAAGIPVQQAAEVMNLQVPETAQAGTEAVQTQQFASLEAGAKSTETQTNAEPLHAVSQVQDAEKSGTGETAVEAKANAAEAEGKSQTVQVDAEKETTASAVQWQQQTQSDGDEAASTMVANAANAGEAQPQASVSTVDAAAAAAAVEPMAGQSAAQEVEKPVFVQSEAKPEPYSQVSNKILEDIPQKGVRELSVQLEPEELGKIDIKLKMANGKLTIDIIAESQKTQALLMSQTDKLVMSLGLQNVQVEQVQVTNPAAQQTQTGYGDNLAFFMDFAHKGNREEQAEQSGKAHKAKPDLGAVDEVAHVERSRLMPEHFGRLNLVV